MSYILSQNVVRVSFRDITNWIVSLYISIEYWNYFKTLHVVVLTFDAHWLVYWSPGLTWIWTLNFACSMYLFSSIIPQKKSGYFSEQTFVFEKATKSVSCGVGIESVSVISKISGFVILKHLPLFPNC
jgi:hypothetical protein